MSSVITVAFSSVDEFLEELERDVGDLGRVIERGIVRLGQEVGHSITGPQWVLVVASYVTRHGAVAAAYASPKPQLVELRTFAGYLWGLPDQDEGTNERVLSVGSAVRQACERMDLDCRNGGHRMVV